MHVGRFGLTGSRLDIGKRAVGGIEGRAHLQELGGN